MILGAVGYALFDSFRPKPTLVVRDAYLLVRVEAPPEWDEKHSATIVWEGREVQLPVVLRCRVTGPSGPNWGAVGEESQQALTIQGVEVAVRITPPTACQVSNELALGVISQRDGPTETALSIATWVSVGPPDRPSISPTDAPDQLRAKGKGVVRRVEALIPAGRVIDVGVGPTQ